MSQELKGEFDYIHIFVLTQNELNRSLIKLKPHLSKRCRLWVSWPKAKKLDTDLSLPMVIRITYQNGLVESKVISIDDTWSAIKITSPIEGKTYKNSFGVLNSKG